MGASQPGGAAAVREPRGYQNWRRVAGVSLLLAGALAWAQNSLAEHVFQVPRAQLEKALQNMHASSPGRLPILEGFVAPEVPALEKYQRAYYQYKLEVRSVGSAATLLQVNAKVTAWYAGENAAQAGYRVLPSNGRLESDLFERLEELLQQTSASVAAQPGIGKTTAPAPVTEGDSGTSAVGGKTPADSSPFDTPLPLEQPASRANLSPPSAQDLTQQKRVQQLSEQAENLEEILRSQTRPSDLAAVLKSGTPVMAKPIEPSEVLFRADAEDEFKVLDQSAGWVHVQVSGISRGWIRRSELEMPGETRAEVDSPATVPAASTQPETHEETSLFPGDWSPLRGRIVRIIWVRPASDAGGAATDRWSLASSVFRETFSRVSRSDAKIEGVVIVIDAADGGMVAATANSLRRWNTGAISDAAFRKECWADPPGAMGETAVHEHRTKAQNQ
jgi:hypothetical protein